MSVCFNACHFASLYTDVFFPTDEVDGNNADSDKDVTENEAHLGKLIVRSPRCAHAVSYYCFTEYSDDATEQDSNNNSGKNLVKTIFFIISSA